MAESALKEENQEHTVLILSWGKSPKFQMVGKLFRNRRGHLTFPLGAALDHYLSAIKASNFGQDTNPLEVSKG